MRLERLSAAAYYVHLRSQKRILFSYGEAIAVETDAAWRVRGTMGQDHTGMQGHLERFAKGQIRVPEAEFWRIMREEMVRE